MHGAVIVIGLEYTVGHIHSAVHILEQFNSNILGPSCILKTGLTTLTCSFVCPMSNFVLVPIIIKDELVAASQLKVAKIESRKTPLLSTRHGVATYIFQPLQPFN
jgi:hypothetical protein